MHEAALCRAALPESAVVLGMPLSRLSIGHILILTREGLLDLTDSDGQISAIKLTSAVFVCCQTFEEYQKVGSDWLLGLKFKMWRHRVKRAAIAHSRRVSAGLKSPTYFQVESEKFSQYIIDGSLEFPVSDDPNPNRGTQGRIPGTPFILRLQQWLMTTFSLSEPEAWDYPFGLAKMRWACFWEMNGGLDIRNIKDESFDEYARRMDALEAEDGKVVI